MCFLPTRGPWDPPGPRLTQFNVSGARGKVQGAQTPTAPLRLCPKRRMAGGTPWNTDSKVDGRRLSQESPHFSEQLSCTVCHAPVQALDFPGHILLSPEPLVDFSHSGSSQDYSSAHWTFHCLWNISAFPHLGERPKFTSLGCESRIHHLGVNHVMVLHPALYTVHIYMRLCICVCKIDK